MTREFRRVVAGFDANGKTVVLSDKMIATNIGPFAPIWATENEPGEYQLPDEVDAKPFSLEPVGVGTNWRLMVIPPDNPAHTRDDIENMMAASYAAFGISHLRVETDFDPRMHHTNTIDYIMVLEGEITCSLPSGDIHLKKYDTLVQQGGTHGWINHGPADVLMLLMMIRSEAPWDAAKKLK